LNSVSIQSYERHSTNTTTQTPNFGNPIIYLLDIPGIRSSICNFFDVSDQISISRTSKKLVENVARACFEKLTININDLKLPFEAKVLIATKLQHMVNPYTVRKTENKLVVCPKEIKYQNAFMTIHRSNFCLNYAIDDLRDDCEQITPALEFIINHTHYLDAKNEFLYCVDFLQHKFSADDVIKILPYVDEFILSKIVFSKLKNNEWDEVLKLSSASLYFKGIILERILYTKKIDHENISYVKLLFPENLVTKMTTIEDLQRIYTNSCRWLRSEEWDVPVNFAVLPNHKNEALSLAAESQDWQMFLFLFNGNNSICRQTYTRVFESIINAGDLALLKMLLQNDLSIHPKNVYDAFSCAAIENKMEIVRFFLEEYNNIPQKEIIRTLHRCAVDDCYQINTVLLEHIEELSDEEVTGILSRTKISHQLDTCCLMIEDLKRRYLQRKLPYIYQNEIECHLETFKHNLLSRGQRYQFRSKENGNCVVKFLAENINEDYELSEYLEMLEIYDENNNLVGLSPDGLAEVNEILIRNNLLVRL